MAQCDEPPTFIDTPFLFAVSLPEAPIWSNRKTGVLTAAGQAARQTDGAWHFGAAWLFAGRQWTDSWPTDGVAGLAPPD